MLFTTKHSCKTPWKFTIQWLAFETSFKCFFPSVLFGDRDISCNFWKSWINLDVLEIQPIYLDIKWFHHFLHICYHHHHHRHLHHMMFWKILHLVHHWLHQLFETGNLRGVPTGLHLSPCSSSSRSCCLNQGRLAMGSLDLWKKKA